MKKPTEVAMRISIALLLLLTISSAERARAQQAVEAKPCVSHFTEEGGLGGSKVFRTWRDISGTPFDQTFQRMVHSVADGGWGTVEVSEDVGTISAGLFAVGGVAAVAPLDVVVQERTGGTIRIFATWNANDGQGVEVAAVRRELCRLLEAAAP